MSVTSRNRGAKTAVMVALTSVLLLGGADSTVAGSSRCSVTLGGSGLGISKYTDLQAAIDHSPTGATLRIKGVCVASSPEYSPTFLVANKSIRLVGAGRAGAVLRGGGSDSVLHIDKHSTVELINLAITGGGGIYGAGIYSEGVLTATSLMISENRALGGGGGLYNLGTATIKSSTLTSNGERNGVGGGIYNAGTLSLEDSVVSASYSYNAGGGIYSASGAVTLTRSTVTTSHSNFDGGGIYIASGTITLDDSTVSGNTARDGAGGGIYNQSGTVILSRSTVSGNVAESIGDPIGLTGVGGGIYNDAGVVIGGCPSTTAYFDNTARSDPSTDDYAGFLCE